MMTEFDWLRFGMGILMGLMAYLWMWFIIWDYEQRAKEVGRKLYEERENDAEPRNS